MSIEQLFDEQMFEGAELRVRPAKSCKSYPQPYPHPVDNYGLGLWPVENPTPRCLIFWRRGIYSPEKYF
jgi:hypothetical protein